MAVPAYTTDLLLFSDFEGSIPSLGEFANYAAGRGQSDSTDYPIQGTVHIDTVMNATGQASCSIDYGSNISWTSGWSFFSWLVWTAPGAIATQANGGFVFMVGSSISAYDGWFVGGSDFGSYPYGGWQNFAVNPEIGYSEQAGGGPGTSYRYVGLGVDVTPTAVAKGSPLGIDAIRYGYGQLRVANGSSGDGYASFAGMAAINDNNSNRWGLFQAIEGGYKYKGHMILGYGALTEFTDSNKSIVIDNTEFVTSTFNTIEIRNASSEINMTAISISALGTVSPGRWVTTDNAIQNIANCTFTDMDVFGFASNSTLTNSTWRGCALVTQNSATFDGCTFDNATGAVALLSNDPELISDTTFNSDGTGHAIELTTACAGNTYNFDGNTFTGYASSDGSTGDECIYNNAGAGLVTINCLNMATKPTIMNGASATTTVNLSVTIKVTVVDKDNKPIPLVQVAVYKTSDDTQLMNADTETLTDGTDPFVIGVRYTILTISGSDFTTIGAASNEVGVAFTATGTSAGGTGTATNGIATVAFSYLGSEVDIYVRARKSSTGASKYIPVGTTGTITDIGFTVKLTMYQDTNVSS